MEEKIENNSTFQLVEGDDDVLLIDKDTFTVARLKELLSEDFRQSSQEYVYGTESNKNVGTIDKFLSKLSAGQKTINRTELIWKSILNCQFLKVGSKGWQKGKVRIKVSYISYSEIIASLEFSPDEPPQPESPLDDLRELPEYKQQL
jgi:hypothetical protein